MTRARRLSSVVLLLAISTTGCGSGPAREVASVQPGNHGATGTVLSGRDLHEHGGTLLAFLYTRVSGMVVDFAQQPCPRVQLRGRKSLIGSTDPVVYVDGARTANSCVLEMLSTRDLDRVEIYPMGVSNRPGYEAHPNGLILVFVRDGRPLTNSSTMVSGLGWR